MMKAPSRFAAKLTERCWFSVKSDRYATRLLQQW